MSVIPLTLTISLCLVFTFVIFFLREHGRQRFSSAESDALLPLADETPRPAVTAHRDHASAVPCGCRSGKRTACADCRSQSERGAKS